MTADVRPAPVAQRAPRREFRPEIEGLRALAAFLVMTYHIFLGRVSGGVDVFFVVAGFLITGMLAAQVASHGMVQPGRYFSRLAARLLPLSLTVLAVVTFSVLLLSPPWRQKGWWQEIVASAVYLENWQLANKSVVYLGQGEPMSPVQHYWALSIQGQFYVLWLALFVAAAFLARRWALHRVLLVMLVALFAASLAFSVWLTNENQPLAYFHTGTRVWEFAAGGLLALLLWRLPSRGHTVGLLAGWLGVAMIVSGGLLFTVSSSFPGYMALWPVVGCALVLWAGHSPAGRTTGSATWLLGSRQLVFLGGVSYGIYLWHWPLLTFYRARFGEGAVPLLPGLIIMATSVLLAIVTGKLLEKPVRVWVGEHLRPWTLVGVGATTAALVAAVAFGLAREAPVGPARVIGTPLVAPLLHPGAAAGFAGSVEAGVQVPFAPDVMTAFSQRPQIYAGCHQDPFVAEPRVCTFGDTSSPFTVMLVGGSHSAQFFEPLKALADTDRFRLLSVTKSACRFTSEPQPDTAEGRSCEQWNAELMNQIRRDPPDVLVTTSTVTGGNGVAEQVPAGYLAHFGELAGLGVKVLAIRDTPRWPSTPLDCLWNNDPGNCRVERSWSLADTDPAQAAPMPNNVTLMDLTDLLCEPTWCPAVVGNLIAYYDGEHLTPPLASTLAPTIGPVLKGLLPRSAGNE